VVNLLLAEDNVDPDSKDNDGHPPLWWAFMNKREVVEDLMLADDPATKQLLAIARNIDDRHQLRLLPFGLAFFGLIPTVDTPNRRILPWTIPREHESIVKLLLTKHDAELYKESNDLTVLS
jgi:hypothetical protein